MKSPAVANCGAVWIIFFHRNLAFPMLRTFDHPRLNVSCTRRERSNTPLQALTQLNDETFIGAAQAMGRRLIAEAVSPAARIERAFLLCLARQPTASERRILMEHYQHLLSIRAIPRCDMSRQTA